MKLLLYTGSSANMPVLLAKNIALFMKVDISDDKLI